MTHQRAMWQNFGLRLDDMTTEDFMDKVAMLQAESEAERRRNSRKA